MNGILSISIVYYNNDGYLEDVLTQVLPVFHDAQVQVFLIDNASTDRTPCILDRLVSPDDPWVTRVKSPRNLGFGCAHNLVLDRVQSQYHLICNPDIILKDVSPLMECLTFMAGMPDVGLATVRLLNPDGSLQATNKRYPNVLDHFLRRFCSGIRWPLVRHRMERYEMRDVGYESIIDVPFVTGAFMMVRTDLLRAVGGFDPRYFLYFEDADLCRKIQKTHRTVYYPYASVIHFWKRAAHKQFSTGRMFVESGIRYFNKWGWKLV